MKPPEGEALRSLASGIDKMLELRGAGIAFIGDGRCVALRPSRHTSGFDTYVILQEDEAGTVPGPPPSIRVEAIGLGINCAGAILSWAALSGEALAAPVTGGATLLLTVGTVAATSATTLQCAAAIVRTWDATFNNGSLIRWMDSNEWYTWASEVVDGVSLLGAGLSTSAALRALVGIRRAGSQSLMQILKGLSRQERKRLTEEILRLQATPLTKPALKALIRAGKVASRFSTAQINRRIFLQLADAISAALEYAGSATSGNLKGLYIHIVQE
jgi:hypothetical protein